ncbi:MAG TPA: response regulator [Tepidisphaeraceae bacterium]|jgi:CheY-like chemotaxis protein
MARVLIVEDAFDATEALASYLRKAGHTVSSAGNGKEALVAVITDAPDVVLLDLMMPDLDGPSFLEIVRSYLRMYALPVVVMTGFPDSPMLDRIRRLKVNEILVKGKAGLNDICRALEQAVTRLPT